MSDTQQYTKDSIPENTIVITRNGNSDKLYNIEDLHYTREMETGQLFRAVARFYGKKATDYGVKWPKYANAHGEKSQAYILIEDTIKEQRSDYSRIELVCKHLGENMIDVPESITESPESEQE